MTLTADFEITRWEEAGSIGPGTARINVEKTFRGAINGTSIAEVLTAGTESGRGYVASELFTGAIDGREGTIVFQHGGIDDGTATPFTFGRVVAGTGTGELAGVNGEITYVHNEDGARVTLRLAPENR